MLSFILSILLMNILSLLYGTILGFIHKIFYFKNDPLIEYVNDILPQYQCKECGYSSCLDYAKSIVNGDCINKCSPGGNILLFKISEKLNMGYNPYVIYNNKLIKDIKKK